MKTNDFKLFLINSYKPKDLQEPKIKNYIRDDELSGNRTQVYHNHVNNKTKIIHTGTNSLNDAITDFKLFVSPKMYRNSDRYHHAKLIQEQAEQKYKNSKMVTIGHSLGSRLASDLGRNSNKIITYNKPFLPYEKPKSNEINLRTNYDPVSILGSNKNNIKTIPSDSINPIKAHEINQLDNYKYKFIKGSGMTVPNLELSNFDIINICKELKIDLKDVMAKDIFKKVLLGNYIFNLENHEQDGSHWVALILLKENCFYFDSFGIVPPEDMYHLLTKNYKKVYYNKVCIQNLKSILCGWYCIYFIYFMTTHNKDDNDYIKKFEEFIYLFNNNTSKNDKILKESIEKIQ